MLSAPTSTAPAASRRSISVASRAAFGRARLILEPATVESPSTSNRFFTAKGTPASGSCDLSRIVSIACAFARARSAVTAVKALSVGLSLAMRASASSTTPVALAAPEVTACAISAAEAHARSLLMRASRLEHGRGLGLVRQRELGNQHAVLERHREVGLHRRPPLRRDRQRARRGRGGDVVVERIGSGHGLRSSFGRKHAVSRPRERERRVLRKWASLSLPRLRERVPPKGGGWGLISIS